MQGVAPTDDDALIFARAEARSENWVRLSQEHLIMRCVGLWRSIILSSLGKTLYPYSQYVRTLDLRDLEELFKDSMFKDKASNHQK